MEPESGPLPVNSATLGPAVMFGTNKVQARGFGGASGSRRRGEASGSVLSRLVNTYWSGWIAWPILYCLVPVPFADFSIG
jgi:hypothetical protein